MKLPSAARFAEEDIKTAYYKIKEGDDSERQLFKWIDSALDEIEANAFCGTQVPKRLIPKEYTQKYDVKNLWKYNLSNGWRLLYSIANEEVIVVSIILEWLDHKEYERRFKY